MKKVLKLVMIALLLASSAVMVSCEKENDLVIDPNSGPDRYCWDEGNWTCCVNESGMTVCSENRSN